jgi:hypothetical protein
VFLFVFQEIDPKTPSEALAKELEFKLSSSGI